MPFLCFLVVINQIERDDNYEYQGMNDDIEVFSGNSGNSAVSAKGKDLTNIKMYLGRKVFSKGKIEL